MTRPLIGITMDTGHKPDRYSLWMDYTASVEKAGGLPLAIPYMLDRSLIPQLLDRLDGLMLTGGDDIDPALYGQSLHPEAIPIDPNRTRFEMALLEEVERRRLPTLCICLGCQILNVHRGGTLHQFLPDVPRPSSIEHRRLGEAIPRHMVRLVPDTPLSRAVGRQEVLANTYHKQAIDRLGRGLRIVATAPDGVVEAVDDPAFPLMLGVQWHPERLHNESEHLAIFGLLTEHARRKNNHSG
jgi:putative glutamine amidotransferase